MKDRETCSQDSFETQGTGFRYSYDGYSNTLSVASLERQKVFAKLKFDHHLAMNPHAYVAALDKTNQIKALMYSNNATINLAETIDEPRVSSLIDITAQISRYAYDLLTHEYDSFSALFCADYNLKALKLRQIPAHGTGKPFYVAKIQTQHNNSISVQGCTLPVITEALSDKTLRDLITMEFGHYFGNSAQNLLNASSKLSIISRVLDEDFTPAKRLKSPLTAEEQTQTGNHH